MKIFAHMFLLFSVAYGQKPND